MSTLKLIYVCKIKLLGFGFAVETKELAEEWVGQDPEMHYFEELKVRDKI